MKKRTTKYTPNRKIASKPNPRSRTVEPKRKPYLHLEALEPRILLSATWIGTDGDDSHDAGNQGDELYGMGGNDVLHGGTGADTIDGGTGNDQLLGDQGNDILISGGGSDTMDGGVGSDTFQFTGAQHGDSITVVGGNGPDTIDLSAYHNSDIHDNGSSMTVDLGGGQSFAINYSGIESIQTLDGTYAPGSVPAGEGAPPPPPPPANIAPTALDGAVILSEDSSGVITLAGTDPDAGDAVDHYVIDSVPAHGSLLLNGNAVLVGDSVSQTDIAAGNLSFTPDANWNGDTSFAFHAHDGDALSANAGSFAIHVDPVNDAPAATSGSVTINEDASGVITLAGTDPDAGDVVDHYVIDSVPAHGSLLLNGNAVQAGDSVSQADIDAGHLTFTPNANWSGNTSISFHAHDGDALSANAGSFAIHVDPVNDAPNAADDAGGYDSTTDAIVDSGHPGDHTDGSDTVAVGTPPTDHQPDAPPTPVPAQPPHGSNDAVDHTPVGDEGQGSNTDPTGDTGPSAPSNIGHVNFQTVQVDSREVKWGSDENIAVLDPLQHLAGRIQFNIAQMRPEAEPQLSDLHTSQPVDSAAHFVPTAIVELAVPKPITMKAELVAFAPNQKLADVFQEVS
ncbi:MAG: Ig-like domain-containing protein, partial [Phycisphaerales bacterium]|nr:Ig-like domain-containing protein [Phycisphaerales bacterium]